MKKLVAILCFVGLFSLSSCVYDDDSESLNFGCGEGLVTDCSECATIDVPVCGCDGITYQNACLANCQGVYEYTTGTCP